MMREDTIGGSRLVGTEAGYTLRQIRDTYPEVPFEFLTDPLFRRFTIWGAVDKTSDFHFEILNLKGHLAELDRDGNIIGQPPEVYDAIAGNIICLDGSFIWCDVRFIPITKSLILSSVIDSIPLNEYISYIVSSPELDIYHGCARDQFFQEKLRFFLGDVDGKRLLFPITRFPPHREIERRLMDTNLDLNKGECVENIVRLVLGDIVNLFALLEHKLVFSDGILPTTMLRINVDSRIWQREGLCIDLYNGDIINSTTGEIEFRDVILRTANSFELSNTARVAADRGATAPPKGSTNGTMVDAVRAAFLDLWSADTPAGMSRKEIDPIIRESLGHRRDGKTPSDRTIGTGISLARAEIAKRRR